MTNMIDWQSQKTHLFFNPRHPLAGEVRLGALLRLSGHIWLATSGTTATDPRTVKLVALSKAAFLSSAASVNRHIQSDSKDVWMKCLPDFHVGGLSIYARSHLSGAQVVDFKEKWNPLKLKEVLESKNGTLLSLVPTQVYDLVTSRCLAPTGQWRGVIVGGDSLSEDLYKKGWDFGWPLYPSYGCTECCSQVATAKIAVSARHLLQKTSSKSQALTVLSHIEARTNAEGLFQFKGPSLFTGYAFWQNGKTEWIDPKENGWWTSSDRGEIHADELLFHGRNEDQIKIGGEILNLQQLQSILDGVSKEISFHQRAHIAAAEDPRLGYSIQLLLESQTEASSQLIQRFNESVPPFARIRSIQISLKKGGGTV